MFGIEFPELVVILVLALILFGPQKLPELAQSLGQAVRRFKQASSNIQQSMPSFTDITTPRPAPHPYPEQICPQCQQRWSPDFTFCPVCGQRLRAMPPASETLAS